MTLCILVVANQEDLLENVHQLSLVLVDSLDLNIEEGIRGDLNTTILFHIALQLFFVVLFYQIPLLVNIWIVSKHSQTSK